MQTEKLERWSGWRLDPESLEMEEETATANGAHAEVYLARLGSCSSAMERQTEGRAKKVRNIGPWSKLAN